MHRTVHDVMTIPSMNSSRSPSANHNLEINNQLFNASMFKLLRLCRHTHICLILTAGSVEHPGRIVGALLRAKSVDSTGQNNVEVANRGSFVASDVSRFEDECQPPEQFLMCILYSDCELKSVLNKRLEGQRQLLSCFDDGTQISNHLDVQLLSFEHLKSLRWFL